VVQDMKAGARCYLASQPVSDGPDGGSPGVGTISARSRNCTDPDSLGLTLRRLATRSQTERTRGAEAFTTARPSSALPFEFQPTVRIRAEKCKVPITPTRGVRRRRPAPRRR